MKYSFITKLFSISNSTLRDWFLRNYASLIDIVVVVMFSWFISRYAHRVLSKILGHILHSELYPTKADREKRVKTLSGLGSALIRFFVWVSAGVVVINIIGINTVPFLASASVIGVALGFGAQKLINDLVSGIFIIFENQYRVGDFVELEGVSGTVEDITIRTTVLRDLNGAVHHVPNGSITVSTNRSMGYGQLNLDISVAPSTDLKKLEKIINEVGKSVAREPELSDAIIEPPKFIRVSDFTGNSIVVKVMGKTTGGKQLEIKSIFYTDLKKAFDDNNIKLAVLNTPSMNVISRKKH